MKLLLTTVFVSISFLYAQENGLTLQESYSQKLNENAAKLEQKNTQTQEIISNLNTVLLQSNAQRSNIKIALNYYFDFAQPCQAAGNKNSKNAALPGLNESNLICEELLEIKNK